jgi:hypothetical protein
MTVRHNLSEHVRTSPGNEREAQILLTNRPVSPAFLGHLCQKRDAEQRGSKKRPAGRFPASVR